LNPPERFSASPPLCPPPYRRSTRGVKGGGKKEPNKRKEGTSHLGMDSYNLWQWLKQKVGSLRPPFTTQDLSPRTRNATPSYAMARLLHKHAEATGCLLYVDHSTKDLIPTRTCLERYPQLCNRRQRHCPPAGANGPEALVNGLDNSADGSDGTDSDSSGSVASSHASLQLPVERVGEAQDNSRISHPAVHTSKQRLHGPPVEWAELDMEDFRGMPHYIVFSRIHRAAMDLGRDCYRDPCNGCVFFTRSYLAKAPCCGEDCRHCPYGRVACHGNNYCSSSGSSSGSEVSNEDV